MFLLPATSAFSAEIGQTCGLFQAMSRRPPLRLEDLPILAWEPAKSGFWAAFGGLGREVCQARVDS